MAGKVKQTRGAKQPPANKRKKRRRSNRTLYYILITVILLAAGITLSLTVFFKIESVTAVGVDKYPPDDVVAKSGIQTGGNLFRVDSAAVRDKLKAEFPYIDEVELRLKLPNEIQLEVTQCKPGGALLDNGEYLIITREGKVLERGLLFIPESIPLIKGIDTGGAQPGKMLGQNSTDALIMLDYLYKAADETSFGEITNVDLTDIYNMKIVYENRLLLNLGTESELPAKLNFLKETIANRLPDDAEGLIDASDISRSLIYTPMTIAEAESGKKHNEKKPRYSARTVTPDEPDEQSSEDDS